MPHGGTDIISLVALAIGAVIVVCSLTYALLAWGVETIKNRQKKP